MNIETTKNQIYDYVVEEIEPEFTRVMPRTKEVKIKKKVIPPPTPPKPVKKRPQIIVTSDEVENIEKEVEEFKDLEDVAEEKAPEAEVVEVAPKIELPIKEEKTDEILVIAEQMPIFGDCQLNDLSGMELRNCSDKSLMKYIMKRLKYPAIARESGITGNVILQFVVDKTGKVKDVNIARDIGGGCGMAAKNVITKLPNWKPGKQNGRPVSVLYTVPINFNLK